MDCRTRFNPTIRLRKKGNVRRGIGKNLFGRTEKEGYRGPWQGKVECVGSSLWVAQKMVRLQLAKFIGKKLGTGLVGFKNIKCCYNYDKS